MMSVLSLFVCLIMMFNNISAILRRSVLLGEETGGHRENHRPVASPDKLYHMMLYTSPLSRFEITTALIAWVVVNPTTIQSRPQRPLCPKHCIRYNKKDVCLHQYVNLL